MIPGSAGPLHLVVGDEELLVARAIAEVITAAKTEDPDASVIEHVGGEMTVGDLATAVSPSLFGGRRVVVIRQAQDAKKDLTAAIVEYVGSVDPDVSLVLAHAGGAKGKALADAARDAGARTVD